MKITMTTEELSRMALGIFVDFCKPPRNPVRPVELIDTVYWQAEKYARVLFDDAEVKATITLPLNYVTNKILKWVSGEEEAPDEWILCWCNNWYWWYEDKLNKVMSPDTLASQAVRTEAKRHLDELERSERAVFGAHFLRPRLPFELKQFLDDYILMCERRHESIWESDVRLLLAYGYMRGVEAERKRRKQSEKKEAKSNEN